MSTDYLENEGKKCVPAAIKGLENGELHDKVKEWNCLWQSKTATELTGTQMKDQKTKKKKYGKVKHLKL